MERRYNPIRDLLLALNHLVDQSGMSLREVSRKLENTDVNLSNVCAVANGNPEQLSSIVKFDYYISEILRVTGHDEYDLVKATLEALTNPRSKSFQENLSVELRDFLKSPESEKYLEYAYKRYQIDKLAEEREKLKKELDDL